MQVVKLEGGGKEEVKKLYAEYCALFAARPPGPDSDEELVRRFVKSELVVTDVPEKYVPRDKKTRVGVLYELFRDWCWNSGADRVVSMALFGRLLRQVPGVRGVPPVNYRYVNVVPRQVQ